MTIHGFLLFPEKEKLEPFSAPVGVDKKKAQQDYQLAELEKSIYTVEKIWVLEERTLRQS